MEQIIEEELTQELINKHMWTIAAFGTIKKGDTLKSDDIRFIILSHIIHTEILIHPIFSPSNKYDYDPNDFIDTVIYAVGVCKDILEDTLYEQ